MLAKNPINFISKFLSFFLLLLSIESFGQTEEIPLDSKVITGKLDNGMSYFLRENNYPEEKLELRLVVNAGSMQEDENQLGMAHFMEHMAFNGTENFEKNDLIDFLQSIGLQFGADLNAYTSFEETVYILPIPTTDDTLIDKGLLVLKDWASRITLDPEEVEKERGVVLEEWRLGQGAQQRMRDQYFPVLFQNSRYAKRLPIGTKGSIEGSTYENIKRFYEEWYRPELMAIVAVGSTDMKALEQKIISEFSDIKAKGKARAKENNSVPGHDETLVAVTKDAENSFTAAQLIYKRPKESESTLEDLRNNYLYALYNAMLNSRLQELTQKAEPPFIFGASSFGSMVRSSDMYSSFAVSAPEQITGALQTLVAENERVKLHGFADTELKRAVENLMVQLESAAKEKEKTESKSYASEYVSYFLQGTPSPGIDYELSFFKEMIPTLKVEEINELAKKWITDENRVAIITGIDKEDVTLPKEEAILGAINNVDLSSIEPYNDEVSEDPLVGELPKAGRTLFTKKIDTVGVTELKMSNGMKVVIKSTDFKNDEILMGAVSPGGHNLYGEDKYQSAIMSSQIVNQSGLSDFSLVELRKMLTGKKVEVSPFIGSTREGFSGSCNPENLEVMLQLTHLYFTKPRRDEEVFQSIITRTKDIYANLKVNPQYYFSDQVAKVMSQNHPRGGGLPEPEDLDMVSLDDVMSIYAERFANPGDFTFFFVGNVELETLKPLLEKYLASIPSKKEKETWKDLGIRPPSVKIDTAYYKGTDEKSSVIINFTGLSYPSKDENYALGAFTDILSNRLIDILREDESNVYTVNASRSRQRVPFEQYTVSVTFPCGPENVEKLTNLVYEEIAKTQKEGVTQEDIIKVQEADRQNRKESLRQNGFWLGQLRAYYFNDSDLNNFYQYETQVDNLNSDDIQEVAKKYVDLDKSIRMVLYPEGYKN